MNGFGNSAGFLEEMKLDQTLQGYWGLNSIVYTPGKIS